ncbi:Site-specific DNA recombinase [Mariprofundus aestuarium]|uniref:Site-specific DNA recombinase n=1 Tax=Mariprofundus aestuarium TaxID=1921086 RepID=A0A2K8L3B1_MARES|nr:recombinase family protein [Mariprofundus aestuarium]ATX80709.1 Site-specific DNA recombinase [Mariprofundus aestuarium]
MTKKAYSYIRFSTPDQLKGDSLRRQLEASRAYAEENGLLLDESLRDIGVSAFRGKNSTEGALKKFIELVEAGRVEKGSILILESLDRLSRQQIFTALSLFSSIIEAGVEIVTLADNQHYTAESVNDIGQLMYSLISMSRSHEESAIKSKRSAASWENRRRLAVETKRPITGKAPHWLRLSDDKQRFEVIEEHAEIVRSIFSQSIAGVGRRKIASSLNEEGVTPFGRAKMWHTSYIARVLSSRSTMGEYQPCQNGEPVGSAIKDYYPSIISEQQFYHAQSSQQNRRKNKSAGRKGPKFSNLFTGMCKCLECESTYRFMNRGNASLLLCDSNYMAAGCECSMRWRYRDVENASLIVLSEQIDWFSALGGHANSKQKLESEIASLNTKLSDTQKQVDRFAQLFSTAGDAMFSDARSRYLKAMQAADEIKSEIEQKESELLTFTPTQQHVDALNRAIYNLGDESDEQKLYELRAQINATFKDAGLRLYFNESGVYFYVRSTQQKGVILYSEHEELLSMGAELEIQQRTLEAINEDIADLKKAA